MVSHTSRTQQLGKIPTNGKLVLGRIGGEEETDGHLISYKYYKIYVYSVYYFTQHNIFLAFHSICWMNLLNE